MTASTYEFDLILAGVPEITEELADALFAAGCDDGSPSSRDGVTRVRFHRDALSFGTAVRSAIANVRAAGVEVERIEFEPALVDQLSAAGA